MNLHPDHALLVVKQKTTNYDKHQFMHRAEAERLLQARRREDWDRRRFYLRYRLRNLMSRLLPGMSL